VLAVFICTAIVYGFQLLRPLLNLQKLIIEKQSSKQALKAFEYPHDDEIGQLIKDIHHYAEDKS
jgi:methyl-accepting chemotaxis protein